MNHKILLVDDEPANLRLLERLFRRDYEVLTAASGEDALRLLSQHDVALVVTDQRMPGMTGVELLARTFDMRPHMVRILLTGYTDMGALLDAINRGQIYRYVTKPWDNDDLRLTVAQALRHYEANRSRYEAEESNRRLADRLRAMSEGVVRAIADILEAKDRYVYGHARRVSGYASAIGRRMRLGTATLEQISLAALLHDVGKISTPDSILLKPAALTEEERAVVRLHSERGARLLAAVPEMEEVAAAVRHHHENWDGTGYPEGLAGERIPLASRVIHVADAYDAMTSPRPFRDALGHDAALRALTEGAGTQFDPEVVAAFCGLEALAQIRAAVTHGAFGSQYLPAMPPGGPRELAPEELVMAIKMEPVLAASVLHAVNGPRRAGKPMASIQTACARVGEDALRALLAQGRAGMSIRYEAEVLRDHSRRCAAAAKLLAEKTGVLDPEEAYTLGLLHDLGEALLHTLFPEEMEHIVWLGNVGARAERERAALGVSHGQVGQWMLEECGLPPELTFAVQTHHEAVRSSVPAALLLHVADAIADAPDSCELAGLDALGADCLRPLSLSRADLARIHETVNEQVGERFVGVIA
ncbi:MAG TPA: HD domain-containing phosphohydrolase [Pyrinomonadaceae bacterium]|nr:HD domain-containing phosphohydrolase [Pyrinomonadaceae bacterium]